MNLQQKLKDACAYHENARFRNNYSGRAMYGKRCVGIVGSYGECMAVIAKVIIDSRAELSRVQMGSSEEECTRLFTEAVYTLLNYTQDNMGLDIILYWPSLGPVPEPTSEELDQWAGEVARGHK